MIDLASKLLIFIKDFTGRGADSFYWFVHDRLEETNPTEIVAYPGPVVCHDFWIIRDLLYDKTGGLPEVVLDIDEFRISIGGNPDDRRNREKIDISAYLGACGASEEVCSAYKRMFNRAIPFDAEIATKAAGAIAKLYLALCAQAAANGEMERFFSVEMPVYRLLQKAMSAGIMIKAADLSAKRREAEHDYFYCLKNYSAKHDMPLETPSRASIERKLHALGFEFEGVSTRYVLEFVPHPDDFGGDTLALEEFDAAKRVLSSLTLADGCTRPIVDVFGSRTSRILLRNPPLQSISKKYRSIIRARQGAELSYVDFDQFEVGIMAALSGDEQLAALYSAGDMYELFAGTHLGLTGNRKAAKQLFLSYAYGMSRKALVDAAVELGAERTKAKDAFRVFARYEEWKTEVCAEFQRTGRIATEMGNHYARSDSGVLTAKERRSAVSQVVQGTGSLIFKKALLEVERLDDVTILIPMHDALLFEHRLTDTPSKVITAFEHIMTKALGGRVAGKASTGNFTPV